MSLFTDEQLAYFMAHKDDDQRPNLIATVATCLVIPYGAVILRIVCRRRMRAPLLLDDWLIIAAMVGGQRRRKLEILIDGLRSR